MPRSVRGRSRHGSGVCFVHITPVDSSGLVYRSYGIFSDGMLLVFNSFGDSQDTAKDTGAREFYFFPRAGIPELLIDPGLVSVATAMDRGNRGGVEFPAYSGLMLDAGFRMGEIPSGRPDAESVFRDANGRTCPVKNREVFAYASGGPSLRFDDAGLKAFLAARCPTLSVYS